MDDAARYAWRERNRGIPVVVSFETAIENAIIDGKDFLYAVFQLWDREGRTHLERVRATLSTLYGAATCLGLIEPDAKTRLKSELVFAISLCMT